jgi:hypothetical protein
MNTIGWIYRTLPHPVILNAVKDLKKLSRKAVERGDQCAESSA